MGKTIKREELVQYIRDAIREVATERRLKREAKGEYPCGTPNANPHHNTDGEWSSEGDATSWAINAKGTDCQSGQYKGKKYKGPQAEPCGRKDRRRKCKDPKESLIDGDDSRQDLLYRYEKQQGEYEELKRKYHALKGQYEELYRKAGKPKGMSFPDCVKSINKVVQSTKGDLFKATKKK
jgi:hypothetical protein